MGLLDISSFFTGLIINLLLVSLVCYYFKQKYENLEAAQIEQAKVLYDLLKEVKNTNNTPTNGVISQFCMNEQDNQSELSESSAEEENNVELLVDEEISDDIIEEKKQINIDDEDLEYNKMNVRALRDLLQERDIYTNNKMKKNELIVLLTNKKSLIVDLAFENEDVELKNKVEDEVDKEKNEEIIE